MKFKTYVANIKAAPLWMQVLVCVYLVEVTICVVGMALKISGVIR